MERGSWFVLLTRDNRSWAHLQLDRFSIWTSRALIGYTIDRLRMLLLRARRPRRHLRRGGMRLHRWRHVGNDGSGRRPHTAARGDSRLLLWNASGGLHTFHLSLHRYRRPIGHVRTEVHPIGTLAKLCVASHHWGVHAQAVRHDRLHTSIRSHHANGRVGSEDLMILILKQSDEMSQILGVIIVHKHTILFFRAIRPHSWAIVVVELPPL